MLGVTKENCTGCGACQNICPKGCIGMRPDGEGFWYPEVDTKMCIKCGLCQMVCPALAPADVSQPELPLAYAAYTLDAEVRRESSSGGVFTELARSVLRRGGVVFGAAMDSPLDVVHQAVESEEELSRLRGSKYVQSRVGLAYQQAKLFLEQGRLVLFTGTPCQIGGLLAFLNRNYDNLITQDIVCHGVPSPKVWDNYVQYRQRKNGKEICQVSFRDKTKGWRHYALRFCHADGTQEVCSAREDAYMRAFVGDLALRPSCYQCRFKGLSRKSDITLADFWGIDRVCPELDDDGGTSLILVHSARGRKALEETGESLCLREVDAPAAAAGNPAAERSAVRPHQREAFFDRMGEEPFGKLVDSLCPRTSALKRVLKKLKRMLVKKRG